MARAVLKGFHRERLAVVLLTQDLVGVVFRPTLGWSIRRHLITNGELHVPVCMFDATRAADNRKQRAHPDNVAVAFLVL